MKKGKTTRSKQLAKGKTLKGVKALRAGIDPLNPQPLPPLKHAPI